MNSPKRVLGLRWCLMWDWGISSVEEIAMQHRRRKRVRFEKNSRQELCRPSCVEWLEVLNSFTAQWLHLIFTDAASLNIFWWGLSIKKALKPAVIDRWVGEPNQLYLCLNRQSPNFLSSEADRWLPIPSRPAASRLRIGATAVFNQVWATAGGELIQHMVLLLLIRSSGQCADAEQVWVGPRGGGV